MNTYKAELRKQFKAYAAMRLSQNGYSFTKGSLPRAFQQLRMDVAVMLVWDVLEDSSLVAVEHSPDDLSFEDLFGDAYDLEIDHGINPNVVKKQRQEAIDRLETEGQWVVETFYNAGEWDGGALSGLRAVADVCGGFVGNDWEGSGYDTDMKRTAIDKLLEHHGYAPVPHGTPHWGMVVLTLLRLEGMDVFDWRESVETEGLLGDPAEHKWHDLT